jgi:hypothetical protein
MRTRMFHALVLGVSTLLAGAGVLLTGCQHSCSSCGGGAGQGAIPVASGNPTYSGSSLAAAPGGNPVRTPVAGASRTDVQPAAAAAVPGSAGNPYGGQ